MQTLSSQFLRKTILTLWLLTVLPQTLSGMLIFPGGGGGLSLAYPGLSSSELILGGPPAVSGLGVSPAALVCVFHTFPFYSPAQKVRSHPGLPFKWLVIFHRDGIHALSPWTSNLCPDEQTIFCLLLF